MSNDNIFSQGIPASGWEIVTFTETQTKVPGVRTEYYQYDSGVKFHFWKIEEFPETFQSCLEEAFASFPKQNIIVEYVPEVDSWYGQIKNIHTLTPSLIEGFVGKISRAVEKHGK